MTYDMIQRLSADASFRPAHPVLYVWADQTFCH